MKGKTKSKKYGYFSNLKYVFLKQWNFKKSYIFALLGVIPISFAVTMITTFLPKIVLDCIESSAEPAKLFLLVGGLSLCLVILKAAEHAVNAYERKCFDISRFDLFRADLLKKTVDMDYNNYIYNEIRVLKEKAYKALGIYGVTDHLRINYRIYEAVFSFGAFTTIIAQCNVRFIPILIVCYAVSAVSWLLLEKYNESMKDKRAKVYLQLNYVTYRSKDFSDAKDIRVYNMVDFMMNKISRHLKENTAYDTMRNNRHFINVCLEDFLKFGIGLGAYLYLIHLKLTTDMTIGDFSLYFGAITGFGTYLNKVVDNISNLMESNHHVDDYRSFLDIPDKMRKENGCSLPRENEIPLAIDLKNVSFTYDEAEKPTIDKLSLSIKPGEKLAIVGINGAGKSTLVKLISGLFLPNEGEILVNGKSASEYNRDDYYTLFSTIFQDVSLLPSSIAKNITLCEEVDAERLKKCIELAGLTEKLESLPQKENTLLIKEVNENATAFSGGELQKLLLARALYKDAPIIILDEPTAALDPIAENNMYLKYSRLTQNKTAIYISHRLSSTRFCDRIILLDNAKIIEEGTHDELVALGGKYAEMFETQSKYYKEEVAV